MVFESVRGYVQLASGLTELTRARATEAANGLLSLQGAGMESGSKLAVQVSALAEELLAAATANRHNLTALVRSEVDVAVNRIGLVPAEQLQESQAEVAALRAELAALRASSSRGTTAKKTAAKETAAKKTAAKKTFAKEASTKKTGAKRAASRKAAVKKSVAKETPAVSPGGNPVTMATETQPAAATSPDKPADV
jgi:septal ring factor EnvC (AmiA/AmiB activator)